MRTYHHACPRAKDQHFVPSVMPLAQQGLQPLRIQPRVSMILHPAQGLKVGGADEIQHTTNLPEYFTSGGTGARSLNPSLSGRLQGKSMQPAPKRQSILIAVIKQAISFQHSSSRIPEDKLAGRECYRSFPRRTDWAWVQKSERTAQLRWWK